MRTVHLLRGLGPVAVVAAVLLAATPASAGSWVPQTVPAKQGYNGRSAAVSCVGSTACMAVGASMVSTAQQRALAQAWDGSTWTAHAVPKPTGATRTRLAAVSCTAANACTAVGSYSLPPGPDGGSRDMNPFVVRWNGTAWTTQTVPLPAGTQKAYFNGVSCTTATACKAVGGYSTASVKSGTLIEHWNGSAWAVRGSPNPAGATFSSLNGVSCVGSTCMAVGSYTQAAGGVGKQTFAMQFYGNVWSLKSLPTPAGAVAAGMNGVSCTSTAACTAVGGYSMTDPQFHDRPLATRWNGTSWTEQATPAQPSTVFSREFTGVSCSSATKCTAVGPEKDTSFDGGNPLVERWNGTSWAVQTAPKPVASGIYMAWFTGVSCTSGGCTAVGGSSAYGDSGEEGSTLAERQTATGTAWAIQTTRNGTGALRTDFLDVSCSSATSCAGVGVYIGSKASGPAVFHWNGTTWAQKVAGAAFGSGRGGDRLTAISCPAPTACMGIGTFAEPKQDDPRFEVARPVAQRWNGTTWTSMKLAVPADAVWHVNISGVACTSATACIAVGEYENTTNKHLGFIEHFNGTSWTLKTVPVPAGAIRIILRDVACTAANACTAVGGYATDPTHLSDKPLVLRWNGTAWTQQTAAVPAGATFAELTDVSCTPPKPCTAVGTYSTTSFFSGNSPLVERWTGTSWALQNGGPALLRDVSCPTLTSCTAIGTGFAQGWDGTSWANKGFMAGFHHGVSCTAASACTSVGVEPRIEMVSRVIFAGLVYAHRSNRPSASRYSETTAGAETLTQPPPDSSGTISPELVN